MVAKDWGIKWEVTMSTVSFGDDENVLELAVIGAQLYEYSKNY